MSNKLQCWGKYETWYPEKIFTPDNLADLQEIIFQAKAENIPIHVLGSGHSINDIAVTSSYMIRTEKLCRVLNIDKENLSIRVEGGIKIHDLLDVLIKEGLTLPNQGYITEQSIAGCIATSTHGSGQTGSFSSFVESIELIDGNGTIHFLDPKKTPHLFSAACVHLGCLGVIYALTLKCTPLFKLEIVKEMDNLENVLQNLDDLRSTYPFLQMSLDPYSGKVLVWKYNYTDKPVHRRWLFQLKRLMVKIGAWITFDAGIKPMACLFPIGVYLYFLAARIKSCIDYAPCILSPADQGHYVEMEIALPYEHLKAAINDVQKIILRYKKLGVCMVTIIMLRFVEADDRGYMSTAYGRKSAYISLICVNHIGHNNFFQEIQSTLHRYKGRPHWGKVNFLTKENMPELYGDGYARFIEAKKILDPDNRFLNSFSERVFGRS